MLSVFWGSNSNGYAKLQDSISINTSSGFAKELDTYPNIMRQSYAFKQPSLAEGALIVAPKPTIPCWIPALPSLAGCGAARKSGELKLRSPPSISDSRHSHNAASRAKWLAPAAKRNPSLAMWSCIVFGPSAWFRDRKGFLLLAASLQDGCPR